MSRYPSVEVISFTHNETTYIDYFVKWYSSKFSNLKITIFDNHSTDDTVAKAKALGCEVKFWGEADHVSEVAFKEMKNNCYKDGDSEYFIICDIDEFLDVDEIDLIENQPLIVQGIGYNMIGDEKNTFEQISIGSRDEMYDKLMLFKRSELLEINYLEGAHEASPKFIEGCEIKESLRRNLYHFRWLSFEFVVDRYKKRRTRVLEVERLRGLDFQYFFSLDQLKDEYTEAKKNSTVLPVAWHSRKANFSISEDSLPNWFQDVKENFSRLPKFADLSVLQIGAYKGDCTEYLLSNHQIKKIVDVDTWEGSMEHLGQKISFKDIEEIYDKKFFGERRVVKKKMTSDKYFHDFSMSENFDFIYIDGSHTSTQALIDGVNSFMKLNLGGILAFDDYRWPEYEGTLSNPKTGIDCWLKLFDGYYELLVNNYQIWIKKTKNF